MWESVLVGGAVFVFYAYAGYPVLLWILARFKARPVMDCSEPDELPAVTVLVAAHNEEDNIAKRIENLLASDYPEDKLEIVVVCDGCSDRTVPMAQSYRDVKVLDLPRRGKASAINEGVCHASGEVIVFADARQRFAPDAIRRLVSILVCSGAGAVGGELVLIDREGAPRAMGAYWAYEKLLRRLEAYVDSPLQCSGAIYAIRREHFVPMPEGLVLDDMWVPLHVMRRGYLILFDPLAKAFDTVTDTYDREFRRKVRTLAGNYQLMFAAPWLLVPWRNRLWWQFVSHKVCRLLVPYVLVAIYAASWALFHQPYGAALVVAQSAYYLLGAVSWFVPSLARRFRVAGLAGSFLSLNAAAAVAPVAFLMSKGRVRWDRSPMVSPSSTESDNPRMRLY